jgi:hypothetical protein
VSVVWFKKIMNRMSATGDKSYNDAVLYGSLWFWWRQSRSELMCNLRRFFKMPQTATVFLIFHHHIEGYLITTVNILLFFDIQKTGQNRY